MKKYPRIVQCDERGQLVIPKDVRTDLNVDEGTGFWVYTIADEGILLKKVEAKPLSEHKAILDEIEEKADKLKLKKSSVQKAVKRYEKTKEGGLELV